MKRRLFLLVLGLLNLHAMAQFKNIKLDLSGSLLNGMVLRYESATDTWKPVATIPSGSTSYIWSGTSVQSGANFWISGNGKANIFRAVSNSVAQGGNGGFNWASADDSLRHTARIAGVPTGLQGGYELQFTAYGGGVSQSNPLTLYRNGNVAVGGQELQLTNATSNLISFPAINSALAPPSVSARSLGTRIVLHPGLSAGTSDYAIGMDTSTVWFSLSQGGMSSYKWYANTSTMMTLRGTGRLGLGTSNPNALLNLVSSSEQFRSGYDTLNYWRSNTSMTGVTTFDAQGTTPEFSFNQRVNMLGGLRIVGGSPGVGKVWTDTTGNGIGAWRPVNSVNIQYISGNATATVSDYGFVCDDSGAAITISLPAAASVPGKKYWIIKTSNNSATGVSVDPSDTELINGGNAFTTNIQYKSIVIISTGTEWFIESSNP